MTSNSRTERLQLSDGECFVQMDGPHDGPLLLLIHGATVPAWEFDRLVPVLVNQGFRTVRADLFGHGRSARPVIKYTHDVFVRQHEELLQALALKGRLNVAGHSLGAAIAAKLALREPDRFKKIALLAPLYDFTSGKPAIRLLHAPLLGELIIHGIGLPLLMRRRNRRYAPIEDGRFVGMFREQLKIKGFGRSMLSLIRNGSLANQAECYRALGASETPVNLLRGEHDRISGAHQITEIQALVPQASLTTVPGTGHAFVLADPDVVAGHLSEFFLGGSGQENNSAIPA